MKKYVVLCAGLCATLFLASCGSNKESAYRKAYEKAKAQEQTGNQENAEENTYTVTPVVTTPVTETRVVDNVDNVSVRQESVTLVSGSGLKDYSVIVGSFSLKANAESLQGRLVAAGYSAQIAYNADRNMYRVVASTFANKADAVRSRNDFRATYPDAWLLYAK
ncbi:SPOR domain-containing protein [Hoylesella marshii]|uniref:Sporulation and cell division repeat protein n=1 Tax=Hoylesella marshii DSM 16973 = JCM 13450 TaxID=862515 RepID=E0NRR2_9BACT|nr:SPOR domain-containing protein [Hoylesella marshii]EFM02200.1 sporulation and cell division repeat protein [Hoylesella marshii DSM 16973 = JCM 13450]